MRRIAIHVFARVGVVAAALATFAGGYALQFIGHFVEGSRSGEEILVRRILGKKN